MATAEHKTIKIALYKLEKPFLIFPDEFHRDIHSTGAIRISEIVEVDFKLININDESADSIEDQSE